MICVGRMNPKICRCVCLLAFLVDVNGYSSITMPISHKTCPEISKLRRTSEAQNFIANRFHRHRQTGARSIISSLETRPSVEEMKSSLLREIAAYSRNGGNLNLKQNVFSLIEGLEVIYPFE
jgi:hypothetical protein